MITPHNSAKLGRWTDYTTNDRWLVATTPLGFVLLAFVGVWLSFSAKYLKQILANFALWVHWHIRNDRPLTSRSGNLLESTPFLGGQGQERYIDAKKIKEARVLAKIYREKNGVRDFVQEFFLNKDLTWKYRRILLYFILFVSVISVGFIIGGVSLVWVKSNGPALLDSKECGFWVFDRESGGDEAATRAGIRDLEKETRAGEYADNCYGAPDRFDAIQCNFLYRRRLALSPPKYTTDCPFQNEICVLNQTVTFTSDVIDASDLGINSEKSPRFRRSTSCTPLSMDYPFIQNETMDGVTTYYYYYGEKPSHNPPVNYTYTTTGDPYDRLAPAYDVFAYITNTTDTVEPYWKPRSELTYPKYSILTLIFVSSLRILYKKWSNDPIFPADEEIFLPGEHKPWFRNSDPRARPLACIDSIDVFLEDHGNCWEDKTCWHMNEPIPEDSSGNWAATTPEFWLMYASLVKTDVYNSIEKRLGRGLLAQKLVSQYFSEDLGEDHWVDEVENLVTTSLARTQINAWSIASGEDSVHEGKDGYVEITKGLGDFCGIFKYNPPGYVSIHFWPLIWILLSFPMCWLLNIRLILITRVYTSRNAFEFIYELPDLEQELPASEGPDTTIAGAETRDTASIADHEQSSSTDAAQNNGNEGVQGGIGTELVDLSTADARFRAQFERSQANFQWRNATIVAESTATQSFGGGEITEVGEVPIPSREIPAHMDHDDSNECVQDRDTSGSTNQDMQSTRAECHGFHHPSQEQWIPQPHEHIVQRRMADSRTISHALDDFEWKPLLINNIFELIYCLVRRRPFGFTFELWQEPED